MDNEKLNAAIELLKPINTPELIAALQHICETRGYSAAVIGIKDDNNLYGAIGGDGVTTILTKLTQGLAKQLEVEPEAVALKNLVHCVECSVGCREENFEPTDVPKEKVIEALHEWIDNLASYLRSDDYKIEVEP